ncbi:Qat anti-phage system QueC-like protein QatC [Rhizobium leguminosarum]|nr:Qat anti-phage system QueC-like protein QatC [Rhizobium leguminosarum]
MKVCQLKFHVGNFDDPMLGKTKVLDVRLYGTTNTPGTAHIGNRLPGEIERLSAPTSTVAYDFLSIALAVTAADSFFQRARYGEDGWARNFELEIPLVKPAAWNAVRIQLEQMLRFLSGDLWSLSFTGGGAKNPSALKTRKRRVANLAGVDAVCLFSGGLDSWLGVNKLLAQGRVPVLVSHAYTGDRQYQNRLFRTFKGRAERFSANASPLRHEGGGMDTSMRTRSFNFLAYAAVAADAVFQLRPQNGKVPLIIPENGFIALNAPLTPRRIGSLSTRTTHPHYLVTMQSIFDGVGINAVIDNPYRHDTKGEMIKASAPDAAQAANAMKTVSCGKWKRKGIQCGHCVPCIIRRSAFFAAGVTDVTHYGQTLVETMNDDRLHKRDDLMSMIQATRAVKTDRLRTLAMESGPLPLHAPERQGWFDVHERGLYEVANYLRATGVMT